MAEKAVLNAEGLTAWLGQVCSRSPVLAPVKRGRASFAFEWIKDPADVRLDYVRTILPPKQAFLPSREPLLSVRRDMRATASVSGDPFVLFGVHPCDLMAINQLDWSMLRRHNIEDPYYLARRKAATIVAVNCFPDKYCFCTSVGSCDTQEGADVFFTPVLSGFMVETLTERGAALLEGAKLREASAEEITAAEAFSRQKRRRTVLRLNAEVAELPGLFEKRYESEVWGSTARRCYSCGTCTNVCPTCFCFDVRELADLSLETATRWRQFDSCQSVDFAIVAGGHNFRGDRPDRVRHRWFRKFVYLNREYGKAFCVGCGRCTQQCTASISLVDVANSIIAEAKERVA